MKRRREFSMRLFERFAPSRTAQVNRYQPGIFSDFGLRRCQRKGHRPPTKAGYCSRCGNFIRVEDLRP
jgi:hypothetical protein